MGFLLADDDGGVVQFVIMLFIGLIWLLGHLAQKMGKQRQAAREAQRRQNPPPASRTPAASAVDEVKRFFEGLQQQAQQRTDPVVQQKTRYRRPAQARARRGKPPVRTKAAPAEVRREAESLAEQLRRREEVQRAETHTVATGVVASGSGLERLVSNSRLSPAARAIVLSEVIGSPRCLHPHRSPFESA